jgi:putative transposase
MMGSEEWHGSDLRRSRSSECCAEVRLGQWQSIGLICKGLSISEQSYYRWRRDYGGLKLDQAKRLKDLERENERLRKAISELTLDKLILKEALEGKY